MQNPQMPNMPGAGAMTDTLDFVKNLWGSMSVPGMSIPGMGAPALSVDDLDKKIADLKAVESWLNVNTAMLRGTIQALEIQRGTLSSLKSMGASFAEAMNKPMGEAKDDQAAEPQAGAAAPSMPDPALWWNVLQDQFKQAVASAVSSSEAMTQATTAAQEAAARMAAAPAAANEKTNGAKTRAAKGKTDKD